MQDIPNLLQFGALAVVVIMLGGIYKLIDKFIDSFLENFRSLVKSVAEIVPAVQSAHSEIKDLRMELQSRPCMIDERSRGS
jgi:hypothetical protein